MDINVKWAPKALESLETIFSALRELGFTFEDLETLAPEIRGNKLAVMATKIEAARLLSLKAALLKDAGERFTVAAAKAKLFASRVAVECALEAIQVLGGYGYIRDYPVERYLRDAKITEIYEGTSEIQRIVISRGLLR